MKREKRREQLESLLLAMPCALQTCDRLSDEEKATGWRIFEKVLKQYIEDSNRPRKGEK